MHHTRERARAMLLRKNPGHVAVRVAGVNDERQFGAPGGFNVNAQALLLDFFRFGCVMVVESGFADANEFGVGSQFGQFRDARQRLVRSMHRVGASGIVYGAVCLGYPAHLRFSAEFGAYGYDPRDSRAESPRDHVFSIRLEFRKVEMAMAVGYLG